MKRGAHQQDQQERCFRMLRLDEVECNDRVYDLSNLRSNSAPSTPSIRPKYSDARPRKQRHPEDRLYPDPNITAEMLPDLPSVEWEEIAVWRPRTRAIMKEPSTQLVEEAHLSLRSQSQFATSASCTMIQSLPERNLLPQKLPQTQTARRHSEQPLLPPMSLGPGLDASLSAVEQAVRHPRRHTAGPNNINQPKAVVSGRGLRPKVNYKSLYSPSSSSDTDTDGLQSQISNSSSFTSDESSHTSTSFSGWSMEYAETSNPATAATSSMHTSKQQQVLKSASTTRSSTSPPQVEHPAKTIAIAPGLYVPFRPSYEIRSALQKGEYQVISCLACTTTLICLPDASYVLCPDCQVVSPLTMMTTAADTYDGDRKRGKSMQQQQQQQQQHGVSLGVKQEWCRSYN